MFCWGFNMHTWFYIKEFIASLSQMVCRPVCSAVSSCSYHRVSLAPRQNLPRIILKGIFQGVKVVRGPDWDWGNQDGEWWHVCVYGGLFLTTNLALPTQQPPYLLEYGSVPLQSVSPSTTHNNILTSRLINPQNVVIVCVCMHLYYQWLIWVCSTDVPVCVHLCRVLVH